ncbi:MAG TPA: DsbA family protein [Chloroflexota bacterium]|nr:DsbA family protein [Chloroflexota bacterium]
MSTMTNLDFYFSPGCQWAWRTALWIRQVRAQRPLNVTWRMFSLATVHHQADPSKPDRYTNGIRAEKTLVAARREHGNDGIERLYMAIGDAYHGRKEPKNLETLQVAIRAAGLSADLVQAAESDPTVEQELLAEHQHAVDALKAFGVPTLHLEGADIGFFGPVVDPVPVGEQALELWDHMLWSLRQPYLWELKRERDYTPAAQPYLEAGAKVAALT